MKNLHSKQFFLRVSWKSKFLLWKKHHKMRIEQSLSILFFDIRNHNREFILAKRRLECHSWKLIPQISRIFQLTKVSSTNVSSFKVLVTKLVVNILIWRLYFNTKPLEAQTEKWFKLNKMTHTQIFLHFFAKLYIIKIYSFLPKI